MELLRDQQLPGVPGRAEHPDRRCDALRWIVHHQGVRDRRGRDLEEQRRLAHRAGRLGRWRQLGEPAHRLRLVREARGCRRQRPSDDGDGDRHLRLRLRHRPEPERHERRLRAARPLEPGGPGVVRRGLRRQERFRHFRRPHRHRRPRQDRAGRRGPARHPDPVLLRAHLRQPRQPAAGRRGQQRLLPRPRPGQRRLPGRPAASGGVARRQRGVRRRRQGVPGSLRPHLRLRRPVQGRRARAEGLRLLGGEHQPQRRPPVQGRRGRRGARDPGRAGESEPDRPGEPGRDDRSREPEPRGAGYRRGCGHPHRGRAGHAQLLAGADGTGRHRGDRGLRRRREHRGDRPG